MVNLEISHVLENFIEEKMRVLVINEPAAEKIDSGGPESLRIAVLREGQHSLFDMLGQLHEALILTRLLVKAMPTVDYYPEGKTARFEMIKDEYGITEARLLESARNFFGCMIKASVDDTTALLDLYSEAMKCLLDVDGGAEALMCLDWAMTTAREEVDASIR